MGLKINNNNKIK